jgi:hypothetical protein
VAKKSSQGKLQGFHRTKWQDSVKIKSKQNFLMGDFTNVGAYNKVLKRNRSKLKESN